jgi:hypothetical protein
MASLIKCSALIGLVLLICGATHFGVDGKPVDVYDELMGNEEKLFMRMLELIDSISGDDDDSGSRYQSVEIKNGGSTHKAAGEKCLLPMRKGVCRALIPRWTYDPATKDCKEFKFGGCDGNGNNFPTEKQCLETCQGM